ncbi:glycosyltransferase family 2 protein [Microbacterium protaetiae]|uniref:glycosyltransferase family 2 protein n=1 Tax=Microbacterium protaetiae TaxID=2509458 RepID=UPI0013EBB38A|nr:glycosyltransferase family 2 protein [Microbacterium protaetiae]
MRDPEMLKVSVIVPTYRSTAHLDELVASLDRQSMPQDDFEVLLIDDGSPDDTYARLAQFAKTRPNYRVFRLPPSGWPSRPRNHGIDQARGQYTVFIDHDDRLFPDALQAAHALATRAGADVLDGKESKSDTPCWAMRDIATDVENAIDWIEPHPLLPMNPHKMFRTAFLHEQGIRFPEGGRQIWEDIGFDIAAHARAEVVSLMVETPFYYWNRPEHATTSGTFHDSLDEYLDAIARVFAWIDDELTQPRFAELLPRFRAYQLRMRLLPLFRWDKRTDAQRARIRDFAAALLDRVPADTDQYLDPWRRIGVALLRAGRFDLIGQHMPTWPPLECAPRAREPRWREQGLTVEVDLDWRYERFVVWRGGRAMLDLDPEVARFATEYALDIDVTDDLGAAEYAVDRRSRGEKVDWMLGHGVGAEPRPGSDGGPVHAAARLPLMWDAADDGTAHEGVWDLYVRTAVMRTRIVRRVRTAWQGRSWAIVDGRPVAVYSARDGGLSVDVGQTLFTVVDDPLAAASLTGNELVITLPHVAVLSEADVAGELVSSRGERLACRLVSAGGSASVRAMRPRPGRYAVEFGSVRSRLRIHLTRAGRVRVIHTPQRTPREVVAALRRRLAARLRRR